MNHSPSSSHHEHENPLIWPILSLLKQQPKHWMIHTLSDALRQKQLLHSLDNDSNQDLFKRNFLLMNALYQLQRLLFPHQWLQVEAMDIQLLNIAYPHQQLENNDPLRGYYLDWNNYHASKEDIDTLLHSFWQRYQHHINTEKNLSTAPPIHDDFALFSLPVTASLSQVRKQWRRLALQWHPDREQGNSDKFKQIYNAHQRLIHHIKKERGTS